MSGIVSAIVSAIVGAIGKLISGWFGQRRRDAEQKQAGRDEAEANLNSGLKDIADDQAQNNAVHRGGAGGVAERLRRRIADGDRAKD